jgi:PTS system nitrogen regulatory IIA component
MNIRKILTDDLILLNLRAKEKQAVIEEMLDFLIMRGQISSEKRAAVLEALLDRERKMSTGMQRGIAIPHCKTDEVDRMVATLAICRDGIDFDAMDGEPSRIFVMTVSPLKRTGPHIQFLAEVSRILNDSQVQEQILQAETAEAVLALI